LDDEHDSESQCCEVKVFQSSADDPWQDSKAWRDSNDGKTAEIPSQHLHLVPPGITMLKGKHTLWESEDPSSLDSDAGGCCSVGNVMKSTLIKGSKLCWPFFRTAFFMRKRDLVRITTRENDRKREGHNALGQCRNVRNLCLFDNCSHIEFV